jgi:Spy/CpxP family protein refolding chaperone
VTRTRILVVLAFVVTFAAGIALGAAVGRTAQHHRADGPSWLARQLDLTPQQQEQMREIWSTVRQNSMRAYGERRRAIQDEREQAVRALLGTPEMQQQYDAIKQDYEKKLTDLAQEGGKAREEAKKKTLEILTEPQRKKFEEIMRQPEERGWGRRGPRPGQQPPAGPPGPVAQ